MELLILICLLIVIVLLAKDKITIKKVERNNRQQPPVNPDLPEIMGQPKPPVRQAVPSNATQRHLAKPKVTADNFETETSEKGFAREIPQEELDEVFGDGPNLEEEEEEWNGYGYPNGDDGFATGVTFDELSTVGALLQQEVLEPALQQKAVDIVQRIQGTELFSLLENSMEGASRKIAALLDRSLLTVTDSGSSNLRKNDLSDFDIGEFV
ncbi:conjugal transfer protein TraD [uncultured Dysgonomonas sp.]|uniref:conjugal transfer protein TraD n=1 Tax=uncultured Dysgonomonas sp. TaxID=206096 RepID=UPI0026115A8F|nr:conjugal transfer protein TraD [uncultured Dysgonomonas sp.]